MEMKQKNISKWPFFKMAIFQNHQFSKQFCENFMDWSGLVGFIDAKGIDVAQSIWL
jgi:hypothetical protein